MRELLTGAEADRKARGMSLLGEMRSQVTIEEDWTRGASSSPMVTVEQCPQVDEIEECGETKSVERLKS